MDIRTGQTVHEIIVSVDSGMNVITGSTFTTSIYKDGAINTGTTLVSSSLIDPAKGVFDFSWSADTTGIYQLYVKNDTTNVLFISEVYIVQSDEYFQNTIYVGI
jgi:hypothetical protein